MGGDVREVTSGSASFDCKLGGGAGDGATGIDSFLSGDINCGGGSGGGSDN